MKEFSIRLRELRIDAGLSQEELGKRVGYSPNGVADWEKRDREPPYAILVALANIFNVTADYLLGRED